MDPNQAAAEKAADAVNPQSASQANVMGVLQGKSPADLMQDRKTHADARRDPAADLDAGFMSRFEQAVQQKGFMSRLEQAVQQKESADQAPAPDQEAAPATPEKPSLLTPPKIGKHGHIRQLKEGMAARQQEWESERATLLKELETLKKSPAAPEVSELMKENERLSRELTLLDITRSPQFASKFDKPRQVTILQAKNIAGDKGAEVETILAMPPGIIRDQKLEELIQSLPPSTGTIVKAANAKLAELDFNRQIEIETAKLGLEDHLKQKERSVMLARQQEESEFNEVLSQWSRELDAFNTQKNKDAPALIENAKIIFRSESLGTKERAAAALNAAILPVLLSEHNQALEEIERLKTALTRYEDTIPGSGSNAALEHEASPGPQSPADRMADFEKRLGEQMRRDPLWSQQRRGRMY